MTRFAERTAVTVKGTRDEIEDTLRRYGADQFVYGEDAGGAVLAFAMRGRQVRFAMPLVDPSSREVTHTPKTRGYRSAEAQRRAWEQLTKQRWRALLLVIKAKLEAIESGIVSFEDAFLDATVLPGGRTVAEHVRPAVERAYATGEVPRLLPYHGEDDG